MDDRSATSTQDPTGSCPKCADRRREREAMFDALVSMQRTIVELKAAMMAGGAQRLMRLGRR